MVVPELWWTRPDQLTDSHVLSRSLHQMRGSNLWPGYRGTTMGKLCAGKVESMFLEHKCHLCALVSLFVILHSIPFMWKNLELSAEKMRIPYTKPLFSFSALPRSVLNCVHNTRILCHQHSVSAKWLFLAMFPSVSSPEMML